MERKNLSADGIYKMIHQNFSKIPDHRTNTKNIKIPLEDACSASLAMFSLKSESLLSFIDATKNGAEGKNIKTLFNINCVPSDTQMREILDPVPTKHFRSIFKDLFGVAQRGGALKNFEFMDGKYLLALDGTQIFSSNEINCDHCLEKNHRNGDISYSHQMVGAAIVYPGYKSVIPLCPEMIENKDGAKKNDCEKNASKRILESIQEDHPRMKFIIIEDGLASNIPHIQTIKVSGYNYILGAKPDDHKYLFSWVEHDDNTRKYELTTYIGEKIQKQIIHKFTYNNDVPLNASNEDFLVNFIDYTEITMVSYDEGKTFVETGIKKFSWVTDIKITKDNIMQIMRGGRARWKIENEVFNTLKNQGYNLEHNFGHGYENLCNNFVMLMMLAFLTDQLLEICCTVFQKALAKAGSKKKFWQNLLSTFQSFYIDSWTTFFDALANFEKYVCPLRVNSC